MRTLRQLLDLQDKTALAGGRAESREGVAAPCAADDGASAV